jgi:hypothetical protein
MTPLIKPNRTTTRMEVTGRELALIDAALFDALVRLLKDSKSFDITEPDDDVWNMEAKTEADIIRKIQHKINFAFKQIELDGKQ